MSLLSCMTLLALQPPASIAPESVAILRIVVANKKGIRTINPIVRIKFLQRAFVPHTPRFDRFLGLANALTLYSGGLANANAHLPMNKRMR